MGRGSVEKQGFIARLRGKRATVETPSPIEKLTDSIVSLNELIDPAVLPKGEIDLQGAASLLSIQYGGRRHYPADDCERCREIESTYEGLKEESAETWVIVLRTKLALLHHAPREGEPLCDCERCGSIRWALGWAAKALATAR